MTNGQQRVVVSTITTGEDFDDGTRWQSVDADTDSDLDYSTVTGQTRLDVGDVVTDGSISTSSFQRIPVFRDWQSATLCMQLKAQVELSCTLALIEFRPAGARMRAIN